MRDELFSREGGSPSPAGLVEEISGDGPLPTQGNSDFSTAIQKLSGMICGALGWTPDQFWRVTPAELVAIFAAFTGSGAGDQAAVPLDAEQLEKLKESFPDG